MRECRGRKHYRRNGKQCKDRSWRSPMKNKVRERMHGRGKEIHRAFGQCSAVRRQTTNTILNHRGLDQLAESGTLRQLRAQAYPLPSIPEPVAVLRQLGHRCHQRRPATTVAQPYRVTHPRKLNIFSHGYPKRSLHKPHPPSFPSSQSLYLPTMKRDIFTFSGSRLNRILHPTPLLSPHC